jgi:hypothetical protein
LSITETQFKQLRGNSSFLSFWMSSNFFYSEPAIEVLLPLMANWLVGKQ